MDGEKDMKKSIICILIFLTVGTLFANPLAKIYQQDDPLILSLIELSREVGILPFSSAGYLTGYDVSQLIEKLESKGVTEKQHQELEQLKAHVLSQYEKIPASARIQIAPEMYWNTNDKTKEYEWMVRYNQRSPFASAETDALFAQNIYALFSYGLKPRLNAEDFNQFNTNSPYRDGFKESQLQNSFPHKAFIGVSSPNFSLVFGRGLLKYAQGNTGNLMLGDHVPYYDFLQASASNTYLRYTFLTIPMNEIDEEGHAKVPDEKYGLFDSLFNESYVRMFISHRLEFFLPKIRISLTEGVLFYTSRADLRMFNPMMFIHNYQNFGEVNNSTTLEVEASLIKGLSLDFQLFLDQIQTKGELSGGAEGVPPNAYAALLALNHTYRSTKGTLNSYIEGVYTSPYAYLRTGDETENYYKKVKKEVVVGHDNDNDDKPIRETVYVYEKIDEDKQHNLDLIHATNMRYGRGGISILGYEYGPDTIVAATGVRYKDQRGFVLSGDLMGIIQGNNGLKIESKSQKVKTDASEMYRLSPTTPTTYRFVTTLKASYEPPIIKGLTVLLRTDLVNTWYQGSYSFDSQFNVGLKYQLILF